MSITATAERLNVGACASCGKFDFKFVPLRPVCDAMTSSISETHATINRQPIKAPLKQATELASGKSDAFHKKKKVYMVLLRVLRFTVENKFFCKIGN